MSRNVTLRLNAQLLKKARHIAVEDEKSLSQWMSDILEHAIMEREGYLQAREAALGILQKGLKFKGKLPTRDQLYEI